MFYPPSSLSWPNAYIIKTAADRWKITHWLEAGLQSVKCNRYKGIRYGEIIIGSSVYYPWPKRSATYKGIQFSQGNKDETITTYIRGIREIQSVLLCIGNAVAWWSRSVFHVGIAHKNKKNSSYKHIFVFELQLILHYCN